MDFPTNFEPNIYNPYGYSPGEVPFICPAIQDDVEEQAYPWANEIIPSDVVTSDLVEGPELYGGNFITDFIGDTFMAILMPFIIIAVIIGGVIVLYLVYKYFSKKAEAEARAQREIEEDELRQKRAKEKEGLAAKRAEQEKDRVVPLPKTPAAAQPTANDKILARLDQIHKRI